MALRGQRGCATLPKMQARRAARFGSAPPRKVIPAAGAATINATITATMLTTATALLALLGCGKKDSSPRTAGPADAGPLAPAADAAAAAVTDFPELAELPRVTAVRELELPVRIDMPRFEVHGPLVSGDVAIVASSQLGFAAIDWRAGTVVWSKPSGAHVAPPLALPGGDVVLLGDCATAPDTEEPVLGCLRIVGSGGADRSYGAVVGSAELAAQLRSPGAQRTWRIDEGHVGWQRGEAIAVVELATGKAVAPGAAGAAKSAAPSVANPPLVVRYKDAALAISLEEGEDGGELLARSLDGKRTVWKAPGRFAALLGPVPGQPYESPMIRVARASTMRGVGGPPRGTPYFDVLDIDAMTAAGGQAAFPAPGIQLLGWGARAGAAAGLGPAAALAIRLDRSLRRDYVVAYTSSARIAWAYPLPVVMRTDAVGVAVTDDAVLAFHDGDTLTVLPPIE